MGLLNNIICTAVISTLGAKLAKGRSPIMAALMMLLVSKALSKGAETKPEEQAGVTPGQSGGLGDLIEQFQRGGLEDVIRSWVGTGANRPIAPNQLQQALGPETVAHLERETGMPRDDLLSQLSRLLPEIIDKLTPDGEAPERK